MARLVLCGTTTGHGSAVDGLPIQNAASDQVVGFGTPQRPSNGPTVYDGFCRHRETPIPAAGASGPIEVRQELPHGAPRRGPRSGTQGRSCPGSLRIQGRPLFQ